MVKEKKPSEKIGLEGEGSFYFLAVLLCLFFLTSCIPTALNEKATCDTGKTFDKFSDLVSYVDGGAMSWLPDNWRFQIHTKGKKIDENK